MKAQPSNKTLLPFSVLLLVILVFSLFLWPQPPVLAAGNSAPAGWRDTGIHTNLHNNFGNFCFDGLQPNTLLINNTDAGNGELGTYSYNWVTGGVSVDFRVFNQCSESNGYFYLANSNTGKGMRFSSREPEPRQLDRYPTHFAKDGTSQVYSLHIVPIIVTQPQYSTIYDSVLYASSDGGVTWEMRGQQFNRKIESLAVSEADGRSIYALTVDRNPYDPSQVGYSIYFSADAGVTWEKRFQGTQAGGNPGSGPRLELFALSGRTAPINVIGLTTNSGIFGSSNTTNVLVSIDGGRSFNRIGYRGLGTGVEVVYTNEGFARLSRPAGPGSLSVSTDGVNWQTLTLPFNPSPVGGPGGLDYARFRQAPSDPSSLFIYNYDGSGDIWYSPDGGHNWRKLGDNLQTIQITPYLPLSLVGIKDNEIYSLDLPEAGKGQTGGVSESGVAGGSYYPETRHNLSGIFKTYWEQHGGLAQFGYPKTEPFREVNPSDGKVYTVQYFERNRFEYHPENAGSPYEVLLGLLGNQLTQSYRDAGHGAFNRFDDAHYPGGTYFSETGHNLRNSFKAYWEANGGLAIYGFPISEEFYEVNPDDGKTYVVQYFERNRFEWHPENTGTRYEVLLGLLGNALLRQKGWL